MKTVKKGQQIERIPEDQVGVYLKDGWEFCPKFEWKEKQSGSLEAKAASR